MKAFHVVADSSCLIGLAQIKQFNILKELFLEVFIPDAVYKEVVIKGKNEVGSQETENAIKEGWIKRKTVKDKVAVNALSSILGAGETETIILAKELDLDYALIDEKTARAEADLMEVKVIGTIGLIDFAIASGFEIDKKRTVDQLIKKGFRISDRLYKKMFLNIK
jgi:predicted nucleic acid-binding protein